jgi:hypothetical protein
MQRPQQPWNPSNPYDTLDPVMQPPELPDISDSVSMTASEITNISSVYGQTIPASRSSLPRYRGSSVYTESSGLAPQDSISQEFHQTQDSQDEEAQLQREIEALERKERIQALRRRKEELVRRTRDAV